MKYLRCIFYVFIILAIGYGSFSAGKWLCGVKAKRDAHHTLRILGFTAPSFPMVMTDEGESYPWPTSWELPVGVVPLYRSDVAPISLSRDKPIPLVYIKPQYNKDLVIVLYSDLIRRELTTVELSTIINQEESKRKFIYP